MGIAIVVAAYADVCCTAAMGVASTMAIITALKKTLPRSFCGFLRFLLLYLPVAIIAICCALGAIIAAIEGWSFTDGFLFIMMAAAKLANPIVNIGPEKAEGCAFETICVCIELCLGGAMVGVIAEHAQVSRFLQLFGNGNTCSELETQISEIIAQRHIADLNEDGETPMRSIRFAY